MNENDILDLLQNVVDRPFLLAGIIILTTFILEDLATTASALITAQTDVHFLIPLSALFVGIVLGDIGLYALGKYSCRIPFLKRFRDNEKMKKAGIMLEKNLITAIFMSRFLPGMRLPTYMAVGAFEISFHRFISIVIVAVGLWSGGLFYLFYTLGDVTREMMGALKWYGLGLIVVLFVFGPKLIHRFIK